MNHKQDMMIASYLSFYLIIIIVRIQMQRYQKILQTLQSELTDTKFNQLIAEIKSRGALIVNKQISTNLPSISLTNFLRNKTLEPIVKPIQVKGSNVKKMQENQNKNNRWFVYFNRLLEALYEYRSPVIKIVYRVIPALACKLIQINFIQPTGLEQCLMTIYNNEYRSYNQSLQDKQQPSLNASLRSLYSTHMLREMTQFKYENLEKIDKVDNTTKNHIKNIIFYLIYREAGDYSDESYMDFYHSIFIYCGVDEKQMLSKGKSSLYLLEKKNDISVFHYPITEEEASWMILTIYELFIGSKKDKFDILAAISILHKKVSNQCQFKMSEVAQSLIQLLEDDYCSVFA